MSDPVVLSIFALVYLGMLLGEFPGLALDRTGIAILGAIAVIATGRATLEEARSAVDVPTMALLFGLMLVSAQFRLGGFYARVTHWLGSRPLGPARLLGLWMLATAALSALLANDIVCLAATPVLIESCARRKLAPLPFAIGLACAANIGSAATLIGNPQNMLIGEALELSFAGYLALAALPALLGLAAAWAFLVWAQRGVWNERFECAAAPHPRFDPWQTAKALLVLAGLVVLFLEGSWPREIVVLAAAGLLLCSRKTASRETLALVDWDLLLLFLGLFVVNGALARSGAATEAMAALAERGIVLRDPPVLFGAVAILSNLVSNVPAVMLLLPAAESADPAARMANGATLALASTLAGNLILVGSIANLIVVDQAKRMGVTIGWKEHARLGIPVTVLTLALAAGWLALVAW
jgi:Na+/H+ antiporter NhaD/arsenite permease-like protein